MVILPLTSMKNQHSKTCAEQGVSLEWSVTMTTQAQFCSQTHTLNTTNPSGELHPVSTKSTTEHHNPFHSLQDKSHFCTSLPCDLNNSLSYQHFIFSFSVSVTQVTFLSH